jgi:pimeloyl-ACP methyl ester carboxylesterase
MSPATLAEYPFEPQFCEIGGYRLAYLDEGSGPPLVMLHGNPSWSYLYRNLVLALRAHYRCIVPDHLGCGFSDKPQDTPAKSLYRLEQHINNLEQLLDALHIDSCVLVLHDWGGAIGMGWAARHPERVAGLVVLNTAAFPAQRIPLRIALCRLPLLGDLLIRGLNAFSRGATLMAVTKPMQAAIKHGFCAPYDSWGNRVAVLRFIQDIPMDAGHPSWPLLVSIEQCLTRLQQQPMLICWGGRDFCFNDFFYQQWQQRFPAAQAHYFADAGHYVLEDALPEIEPLLVDFLQGIWGDEPHGC